ncbi:MAG: sensor histidine kinase [Dehalococcoidales bacterium]|nr:sensor histidine kinase [Dehalococcoidales bacterium]
MGRDAGKPRAVTVRKRAVQEREELRALSRRIVQAQENERRVIARELHNVLGQSMTVLKLILDKAKHSRAEEIMPALTEAQELVDEVVERVRNLSLELSPSMLEDLGLLPTLLWYCQRQTEQTKVQVNFKHNGLDRSFSPEVSIAAYRIVQEALSNAMRYAEVDKVSVRAWSDHKAIFLQVADSGIGFEPSRVPMGTYNGLKGMEERARSLGGKLTIESAPGAGTTVAAELPIIQPRDKEGEL